VTGELANHLWQSTLFAAAAWLMVAALRNNNASVRYWVWFSASLKFFVPFSLLMNLGAQFRWTPLMNKAAAPMVLDVSSVIAPSGSAVMPFRASTIHSSDDWARVILFGIWICGTTVIALRRFQGWRRVRAMLRESTAFASPQVPGTEDQRSIPARSSPGLLEPGLVGLWRPVLLVPAGIEEHLAPSQLQAVVAHETCHARRRDNLTAALHMIVEAVFWFHPLVWWIGARLVDERERACDEYVLRVVQEPRTYAEGILKVCKFYVESPLTCVSGVTGSTNIKKRVENIMNCRLGCKLNLTQKAGLFLAAALTVVGPIGIGSMTAPLQAQTTGLICAESDPAIRLELQSADDKILQVDGSARDQTAEKLAQQLVDRYPNDFIVHIRYQQWARITNGQAALIQRYKTLAASHPGNPMFAILYAQALRNTGARQEAIDLLKNTVSSSFDPWLHLTLAELYSSGQSRNFPEARAHLDEWFDACPTTPNWNALSNLILYGSPATVAQEATVLRSEFESETDPHLLLSWQFVWGLEFKARPNAEYADVRQQIALDVSRLETLPAPNDKRWPELLALGHTLAQDQEVHQ
jgi:beta-lactamase regulating signal transducer with metallopeptidase domain